MIINELQMEDFLKILRDYFRSLKLTQQEIAERTNITQAQVSRLLSGRDKFGGDLAVRFASAFGINPMFLLAGDGDLLLSEPAPADAVPVYDVDFMAGFGELYDPDTDTPTGFVRLPDYRRATAVVSVTGDSMAPLISSGDRIALQELPVEAASIIYGGIYAVATTSGLRTVKRVRRSARDGWVELEPINKAVADTTPIKLEDIAHLWRVLGCIKSLL